MNFLKLTEKEKQMIERVSEITLGDYEVRGEFISINHLLNIIEDLKIEYERKCEELDELKQDLQDNYKPISISEQVE